MHHSLVGIPGVVLDIFDVRVIDLLVIFLLHPGHGQLRLRHCDQQLLADLQRGRHVLQGIVHLHDGVHGNVHLDGDLRQGVPLCHLVHAGGLLLHDHQIDGLLQVRQLALRQIGLHDLHILREIHAPDPQLVILEALLPVSRLLPGDIREHGLYAGLGIGKPLLVLLGPGRLHLGCEHAEFPVLVVLQRDRELPVIAVFIDGGLKELLHVLQAGQVDGILVHLQGVGAVQGLLDAGPQGLLHPGGHILFPVHLSPEDLLSHHYHVRFHEYQFIAAGGHVLPGLEQELVDPLLLPQGSHILSVHLDMEKILSRLLEGRVALEEEQSQEESAYRSFNICKSVSFMIAFLLFHSFPESSTFAFYFCLFDSMPCL